MTRFSRGLTAIVALTTWTLPFWASSFVVFQIGIQAIFLAVLAMSLVLLAGYGGMVSFGQIAFFGVGGYTYSYLHVSNDVAPLLAITGSLIAAAVVGVVFGALAIRTEGIYFLMITLALAMLTYTFALQNRSITRGFSGITGVRPPKIGPLDLEDRTIFYFVSLIIAMLLYLGLRQLTETQFGLALRGIRDNPKRMATMGYNVWAHRMVAFTLAAVIAGIAGVLAVWFNGQMSPNVIGLENNINILLIAVLGGIAFLEGPFVGAVFVAMITTYADSFTDRFNLLIGVVALLIALFLPQGIVGAFHQRHRPKDEGPRDKQTAGNFASRNASH